MTLKTRRLAMFGGFLALNVLFTIANNPENFSYFLIRHFAVLFGTWLALSLVLPYLSIWTGIYDSLGVEERNRNLQNEWAQVFLLTTGFLLAMNSAFFVFKLPWYALILHLVLVAWATRACIRWARDDNSIAKQMPATK